MPRISEFFGVVIAMYFSDHNPPHFHAEYAGDEAEFSINTLEILEGQLPRRARRSLSSGRRCIGGSCRPIGNGPDSSCPWKRSNPWNEKDEEPRRCDARFGFLP